MAEVPKMTNSQVVFFQSARCMHWHVPVFFVITGMLMLASDKKLTPSVCWRKYARRFILVLFLFGVPFSLMELIFNGREISFGTLWQAFVMVFSAKSWDHLWYMYTIIGIYLLLPVLKRFADTADRREMRYVLAVLLGYDFCIPVFDDLTGMNLGFASPFTYPVFYLLLGRYLEDGIPQVLRNRKLCAAFLAVYAGAVVAVYAWRPENRAMIGYNSPLTAVAACCAVGLFKDVSIPKRWAESVWRVDRLCFGVYIIHPLFINFVYKYMGIVPANFKLYPIMLVVFFICFSLVSFFASWVMSLVPPLKKYVL